MARVVVTGPAAADVAAILDYLTANAGRLIAAKYAEAFDAAYDQLAAFPRIGPTRPALGLQARIWIVPPYFMAYDYADDTVTVLRVLHGKRDITGDLIGRR